jgi:hypothetical protein
VLVEDDKCHFDSLPDELLDGAVVDALGLQDLCAFAQVCKKFRSVAVCGPLRFARIPYKRSPIVASSNAIDNLDTFTVYKGSNK